MARLRYMGIRFNHQSNGKPLPRSWNHTSRLVGMEAGQQFNAVVKIWNRMPEKASDDDNLDISDQIARAELAGFWNINPNDTVRLTLRHSLRANSNDSFRLD